jgi:hypothetical protein
MRTAIWALALLVPAVGWAAEAGEVTARLDALYAQRHDPQKTKELEKAVEDALAAHPDEFGVLWRASRYFYWQCDGSTASATKKALGQRAADLAQKALALNPDRIEGHYYAAIGIGCYSQAVGIVTALRQGVEGKFNRWLDKAIALDEGYDNAGPLIAKGRYYFELPWPKRDLKKSTQFLHRALRARPHALRAHLYLAETQLKDGEEKGALGSVEKALEGEETYDVAEARRVKAWAKPLKTRIEEELK